ncbi:MAG TPA: hypothetical protein VNZ57_02935 [Longimicrobiales bacterium]|nr:hypothetical protein [Longimicrobiales bacterium]
MADRRDEAENSPIAPDPDRHSGTSTTALEERILLLECRLEQQRSQLEAAREEADLARTRLAEAAAREAGHAHRLAALSDELAAARAENASLHRQLERSEALRAELEGQLFESGAREDVEELVRLRRELLVERNRAEASERAVARLRERVEELRTSREAILARVAEWQQLVRRDGPEAVDLSRYLSELRREILELEFRFEAAERREAVYRQRLALAGVDPDSEPPSADGAEPPAIVDASSPAADSPDSGGAVHEPELFDAPEIDESVAAAEAVEIDAALADGAASDEVMASSPDAEDVVAEVTAAGAEADIDLLVVIPRDEGATGELDALGPAPADAPESIIDAPDAADAVGPEDPFAMGEEDVEATTFEADAPVEVTAAAAEDAAVDEEPDVAAHALADGEIDVPALESEDFVAAEAVAAPDAGAETAPDGDVDSAAQTVSAASPDAPVDPEPFAAADAAPESVAEADAGPDSGPELAAPADAAAEVGIEAAAEDASTESLAEVAAELDADAPLAALADASPDLPAAPAAQASGDVEPEEEPAVAPIAGDSDAPESVGIPGVTDALVAALAAADVTSIRTELRRCLQVCLEKDVLEVIRPWTASEPAPVRAAAYEALGLLLVRNAAALEPFIRAGLADPDGRVRRRVVLAAAAARGLPLRSLLSAVRADSDPQVRRVVREILRFAPPQPGEVVGSAGRGNGSAPGVVGAASPLP